MNTQHLLFGLIVIATAVASAEPVPLTIDDFNIADPEGLVLDLPAPGGVVESGDVPAGPLTLGGSRNIIGAGVVAPGEITHFGAGKQGTLDNEFVSAAGVTFEYDAFNAGLNFSFQPDTTLRFTRGNDTPTIYSITLTSGLGTPDANSVAWSTQVAPGSGVITSPLFAMAFPGIDLTDVDRIELAVQPLAPSGDASVDNFFSSVPDIGSTVWLLGGALGSLSICRRRTIR